MGVSFTDRYIKPLFLPAGASWDWDNLRLRPTQCGESTDSSASNDSVATVDVATLQAGHPREGWPVMRTYTLRSWDEGVGTIDIDVLIHSGGEQPGPVGVANPWARRVQPGATIVFAGPGEAWRPSAE